MPRHSRKEFVGGSDINSGFDSSGGYLGEEGKGYDNSVDDGGGDDIGGDKRGNEIIEVTMVAGLIIK